jgi:hypothetical protein
MTEQDIHASYLHWLEEASAYRLAEIAGCSAPDSKTSLGAELLGEVRDEVVSAWRAGRFDWDTDRLDHDLAMECAEEGIIPHEYHQRALLFVDLYAYREESEFTERGEWSGTFYDMMADAIGQITERAAIAFIAEVRSAFDQHWVCPGCGDTGTPHICYPDDCRGSDDTDTSCCDAPDSECYTIVVPPVQSVPEAPAEAVLTTQVPEISDPILDLLKAHGEAPRIAGDETAAFMARMDALNRAEFDKARRPFSLWRRPAFWVAVITVAAVVTVWLAL